MGRHISVFSALACLGINACTQIPSPTLDAESCELVPVFMEEFDTLSVSPNRIGPARWTAHTPWWGDFGDAKFTDPGKDGPFFVEDGILTIKAWKDDAGRWRSGLLAAADRSGKGHGTQYGYFEARMKFPPGKGTWPAFWLVPLIPARTLDGRVEVDVVEYYGRRADRFHSVLHVHFDDKSQKRSEGIRTTVPEGSLIDQFNTYGVDISPSEIVYFLNDEEVWRQPTPDELRYPMYPIVNLALGSGWPIDETPDPSLMYVDYVRVYARSDADNCAAGLGLSAER
ncbi:MAG: glycoside hydrolase family 16 protein [Pseudomonadota bacterium]